MVRNLFWALVFANIAYFGWSHWVDVPKPPPVNEAVSKLPRLKLASEQPSPPPQAKAVPEKSTPGESACLSVGPFADAEGSGRAAALLQAKGFPSRARTEAVEPSIGYAVYVGGLRSDAEATRLLRGLQKAGFRDSALVTDGSGGERRVSLGLFGDRAHADVRSAAARSRGFKAEVVEHRSSGTLYWLDLAPPPGTTSVPLQDLFAEGVSSRVTVQPCPALPRPAAPKSVPVSQPAASVPDQAVAAVSKVP
jgi:hypothetical protein